MAANNEIEAATAALKGMAHSEQHYFNRSVRVRVGGREEDKAAPGALLCWLAMNADHETQQLQPPW